MIELFGEFPANHKGSLRQSGPSCNCDVHARGGHSRNISRGNACEILIVTDAWPPQVNGVVRTLQTVGRELGKRGHDVRYITPEGHRTWAIPSYPEIKLSL